MQVVVTLKAYSPFAVESFEDEIAKRNLQSEEDGAYYWINVMNERQALRLYSIPAVSRVYHPQNCIHEDITFDPVHKEVHTSEGTFVRNSCPECTKDLESYLLKKATT